MSCNEYLYYSINPSVLKEHWRRTFTDMSRLIATTMSSSLEKLVPLLEGSNYLIWAGAMRPYLQSQGTWRIINGNEPKPRTLVATATNTAEVTAREAEHKDWNNKDDQAFGVIMLRTATSIKQLGQNQTSLKGLWDALVTALGTPGPAILFADFKTTTTIQINPQIPILDITKMLTIFDRLTSNAVAK